MNRSEQQQTYAFWVKIVKGTTAVKGLEEYRAALMPLLEDILFGRTLTDLERAVQLRSTQVTLGGRDA